jgi:hypothetical protein
MQIILLLHSRDRPPARLMDQLGDGGAHERKWMHVAVHGE